MTKQEIVAKMTALGILETTGSTHPLWREAFNLYNQNKSPKLKMSSCGSCYNMVRQWLKA